MHPPEHDGECYWRMEDVLEVSTRPDDPRRPQVCLDETSRQLLGQVNPPRPLAPGRQPDSTMSTSAVGYATCSWWPSRWLAGARSWSALGAPGSTGRTPIRDLVEVHYPDAEQIVLVKDHLNTHTPASLYAAFPPAEAKRLADRLELHYTPKHGSWLQHGRARAGHAGRTMPGPAAGRPADLETGGRSLEGVAQPGRSSGT